MRPRCFAVFVLAAALLIFPLSTLANTVVAPGYNLFTTTSATVFGLPWKGVPLGTFNFGGSVGVKNVGSTDTIIQRTASADSAGPPTVPIEIVALHLQSTAPINLGFGTGVYFLTLQKERTPTPGLSSTGSFTVNFGGSPPIDGTFGHPNSSPYINLNYDLRFGSISNTPVLAGTAPLYTNPVNVNFSLASTPGALLIPGANTGGGQDFWPLGNFTLTEGFTPSDYHQTLSTTTLVPLPSTVWAGSALLGGLALIRLIPRRRAATQIV